jgi:hypothetical protein
LSLEGGEREVVLADPAAVEAILLPVQDRDFPLLRFSIVISPARRCLSTYFL